MKTYDFIARMVAFVIMLPVTLFVLLIGHAWGWWNWSMDTACEAAFDKLEPLP